MKIKYNSEMIAGAVFVIVAAVLWLLIPSQIQTMETSSINAQTIPRVAIGGLFIFSACLLIQGIFSDEKKEVVVNKDTFHSESFRKLSSIKTHSILNLSRMRCVRSFLRYF